MLRELNCPICRNKNDIIKKITVLNPRNVGLKRYDYVKCLNCGTVFINPMPSDKELELIYSDIYTLYEKNASKPIQRIIQKIANCLATSRPDYIFKLVNKQGKILDIGCGTGTFLYQMQKKRWEVYGIEISEWAAAQAKKKIGEGRVFIGDLHNFHLPDNYFDVITMWHVLEHIKDPIHILKEVHRILKRDGFLILEVPNWESWSLKIFKSEYALLYIPEHVLYWSYESLSKFLRKNGFIIECDNYPVMLPFTFSKSLFRFSSNRFPKCVSLLIYFLSLPFSFIFTYFASKFRKSEIVRICAKKK